MEFTLFQYKFLLSKIIEENNSGITVCNSLPSAGPSSGGNNDRAGSYGGPAYHLPQQIISCQCQTQTFVIQLTKRKNNLHCVSWLN